MRYLFASLLACAFLTVPGSALALSPEVIADLNITCAAELKDAARRTIADGWASSEQEFLLDHNRREAAATDNDNRERLVATRDHFKERLAAEPQWALVVCEKSRLVAIIDGAPLRSGPQTTPNRVASPVQASRPAAAEPAAPGPPAAHNLAAEASDCIQPIAKKDFDRLGVSSTQGAGLRNTCAFPVEVIWCLRGGDCRPGYSNIATVLARADRGISYDPIVDSPAGDVIEWAACRNGFIQGQGDLSRRLEHACK